MKTLHVRDIALACCALALTTALRAQTAPRPAETAAPARETVTLSAFEVTEDASNT